MAYRFPITKQGLGHTRKIRALPSIYSVARYIIVDLGPTSSMKLHKLLYYWQAWHCVWEQEPLFSEIMEAWSNGPVAASLFWMHVGEFTVTEAMLSKGNIGELSQQQQTSIYAVLKFYGDKAGHKLSHLTHQEAPWQDAREGLGCD